jgi:hypothetical protein
VICLLAPEIFEPSRRQRGIDCCRRDGAMAKPSLNRAGICEEGGFGRPFFCLWNRGTTKSWLHEEQVRLEGRWGSQDQVSAPADCECSSGVRGPELCGARERFHAADGGARGAGSVTMLKPSPDGPETPRTYAAIFTNGGDQRGHRASGASADRS